MRHRFCAALLIGVAAGTSCGVADDREDVRSSTTPASPATSTSPSSEGGVERLSGDAEGNLVLYVSNQSFDDERVRLTVAVNGQVVIDEDFDVEGQHNWVRFPLSVPAGVPLELVAESDSGATLQKSVTTVAGNARAVVINHWTDGDRPTLEATLRREPVAFL